MRMGTSERIMTMKKPIVNKIKFCNIYNKLLFIDLRSPVQLLEVFVCNQDSLSPEFLDYDTTHNEGKFPICEGLKLVLIFKQKHHIFTTIRSYSSDKLLFYLRERGTKFQIQIEE